MNGHFDYFGTPQVLCANPVEAELPVESSSSSTELWLPHWQIK